MKRLLIAHRPDAVYTALTENSKPVEFFIDPVSERPGNSGSWVGRVIVGRVKTILPGDFAFVDIGAKKNAFANLPKQHGLKSGLPVLVQVKKDASGTKGMYVSRDISIKGRLAVLERGNEPIGVSRKIEDEKESRRLRKLAHKLVPPGFSAVIRTNAQNATQEELAEEIEALRKAFEDIAARSQFALPPATIYPTAQNQNHLADILSDELCEIHIAAECDKEFESAKKAICEVLPSLEPKISRQPVHLGKHLKAALEKETRLPCGGFITIEQTEACVVIDVNTGSYAGKSGYRQTILDTNLEAATAIAAQIRLRNLSGTIIVDFIDMTEKADKAALLSALSAEVKKDRIRTEVMGFIGLGMVQLTRRKTRPPLSALLQKKCPHCGAVCT